MRDRFRRRDKTIFFFMILLIAILLLGIGYAVIQEVFFKEEKEGPATNYNIEFVSYKTSGSGNIRAEIDRNNSKRASFSITDLEGYGDEAVIEYTIKNKENFPLELDISKSNITNQSYFSFTSNIDNLNHTKIKPNEEKTLIMKVKVTKVNTEEAHIKAKANVSINAKKIEEK